MVLLLGMAVYAHGRPGDIEQEAVESGGGALGTSALLALVLLAERTRRRRRSHLAARAKSVDQRPFHLIGNPSSIHQENPMNSGTGADSLGPARRFGFGGSNRVQS